jgi:hypothetical protein
MVPRHHMVPDCWVVEHCHMGFSSITMLSRILRLEDIFLGCFLLGLLLLKFTSIGAGVCCNIMESTYNLT